MRTLILFLALTAPAIPQTTIPTAPLPKPLATAQKVFIANAGVDAGLFPHPFSGSADHAYNEFYFKLQSWNKFELVSSPAAADLIFELRLTAPSGPQNADKTKGASDPLPGFRVSILDRPTQTTLWAVSESVYRANRQTTHDKNFDDALASIVEDLKKVFTTAATHP